MEPGTREANRLPAEKSLPIHLQGKRIETIEFDGEAVGVSVTGLGLRTADQKILNINIENLFRQAFDISLDLEGTDTVEGCARVIRIEVSRKDPRKEYFIAMKFIYMPPEYEKKLDKFIRFFSEKKE